MKKTILLTLLLPMVDVILVSHSSSKDWIIPDSLTKSVPRETFHFESFLFFSFCLAFGSLVPKIKIKIKNFVRIHVVDFDLLPHVATITDASWTYLSLDKALGESCMSYIVKKKKFCCKHDIRFNTTTELITNCKTN